MWALANRKFSNFQTFGQKFGSHGGSPAQSIATVQQSAHTAAAKLYRRRELIEALQDSHTHGVRAGWAQARGDAAIEADRDPASARSAEAGSRYGLDGGRSPRALSPAGRDSVVEVLHSRKASSIKLLVAVWAELLDRRAPYLCSIRTLFWRSAFWPNFSKLSVSPSDSQRSIASVDDPSRNFWPPALNQCWSWDITKLEEGPSNACSVLPARDPGHLQPVVGCRLDQ